MTRLAWAVALAALAFLVLPAAPALADAASTMQATGQWMITVVRAGAIIAVIACGVALVRGWAGGFVFIPMLIGLAIAIAPDQIVALIS